MSWAMHAKRLLASEGRADVRPRGGSMRGRIESGSLVRLEARRADDVQPGDAVLVTVKGRDYLHLVKARQGDRLLIGNNVGGINGWVSPRAIHGRVVSVAAPR